MLEERPETPDLGFPAPLTSEPPKVAQNGSSQGFEAVWALCQGKVEPPDTPRSQQGKAPVPESEGSRCAVLASRANLLLLFIAAWAGARAKGGPRLARRCGLRGPVADSRVARASRPGHPPGERAASAHLPREGGPGQRKSERAAGVPGEWIRWRAAGGGGRSEWR